MMKYLTLLVITLLLIGNPLLLARDEKRERLLKAFDIYAETQRKAWEIPGMAIGITKGQEVIFLKGYGQRGLEDTRPVDENTLFQTGSLSKAFTAALIAASVDKKWLNWEDKVIEHFPRFHLKDPWATAEFQVVDLLAQRSGLPPYAGDTQAFLGYSQQDMLNHLRFIQPVSSFRSQFAYQNVFFLVAAHLLEKKAQLSYEKLLDQFIFSPLEMKKSNASLKAYLKADNRAEWLMRLKDGSTKRLPDDFPYANWNYLMGPAGGINSTIQDMTKWMILQANQGKFQDKQLISVSNMQRMTRPGVYMEEVNGRAMYYALGWIHMAFSPYPIIWHNGATLGVYNVAAFIPQEQLGIIILSNVRETQLSLALALQFFDMYFDKPDQNWSQLLLAQQKQKQAKPTSVAPKNISPALPLASYVGTYHNALYGEARVQIERNELLLIIGKSQQKFSLNQWDRDIFQFQWPFVEEEGSKVMFFPDDTGNIMTMRLEILSKEGVGDFKKTHPLHSSK
jgi:CubicO group peptidase (beta-lactamase class C family)